MITGAQRTIALLEKMGVECISGIPGGSNLPLYDALSESRITHILARHEQGAGFIAQGMARSKEKTVGVCFATSGPGATNILTAVADAYLDGIPLVVITGQVPALMLGKDSFQEVDIVAMAKPVTKRTFFVSVASELTSILPEAFRIAREGKPGPVLIDIPKNVQLEKIEEETMPDIGGENSIFITASDKADNEVIKRMIKESLRPVLYIGGGIASSQRAAAEVLSFAEKNSMPIVSTLMGMGAFPTDHPLFLGMCGMHGFAAVNHVMDCSDLIIALGVRFGDRATGKSSEFGRHARIIHVNRDPAEKEKIIPADLFISADAGAFVAGLPEMPVNHERTLWLLEIEELKQSFPAYRPENNGTIYPCNLIHSIGNAATDDAIITTDVGQHQMWTAQYYPFTGKGKFITSGGLGTMGFGLPAAIGAALANRDRQVLCFSGDGSLLMNVQELATLAELQLNIKILLFNNNQLGLVRQQQDMFYGGKHIASRFGTPTDFVRIAEGFGIEGISVADDEVSEMMIKSIFDRNGPQLIQITIEDELKVLPMVAPGAANREMIVA